MNFFLNIIFFYKLKANVMRIAIPSFVAIFSSLFALIANADSVDLNSTVLYGSLLGDNLTIQEVTGASSTSVTVDSTLSGIFDTNELQFDALLNNTHDGAISASLSLKLADGTDLSTNDFDAAMVDLNASSFFLFKSFSFNSVIYHSGLMFRFEPAGGIFSSPLDSLMSDAQFNVAAASVPTPAAGVAGFAILCISGFVRHVRRRCDGIVK